MAARPAGAWLVMLGTGGLACAAALALVAVEPEAALVGWLAAALAFGSIPAGALLLQAMMRLIPGAWGEELRLACEAGGLLAPLAAVAFLPVLAGQQAVYHWGARPHASAFEDAWTGPVSFTLRTLLWFALIWLSAGALRARRATAMVATLTLLLLPLLGSLFAVDTLMALDPTYASSGFGLQILVVEVTLAFACLVLLRLEAGRPPGRLPRRPGVLGALLLALLLLWAYLQFMPFLVTWSGNLPDGVRWYAVRSGPAWLAVAAAFIALACGPLLLLLFAPVRSGAQWLVPLCGLVVAGKLAEFAWFALPGHGALAVAAYLLAVAGLGLIASAGLAHALSRRIAARLPDRGGA